MDAYEKILEAQRLLREAELEVTQRSAELRASGNTVVARYGEALVSTGGRELYTLCDGDGNGGSLERILRNAAAVCGREHKPRPRIPM